MLHIILLILKILGILILTILGFLLLCLGLVLLVPLRYRGMVRRQDELQAHAAVSWLFRAFRLDLSYEKKAVISFRIFWFNVFSRQLFPAEEAAETARDGEIRMVRAAGLEHGKPDTDAKNPGKTQDKARESAPGPADMYTKADRPEENRIPDTAGKRSGPGHAAREETARIPESREETEEEKERGDRPSQDSLVKKLGKLCRERLAEKIRGSVRRLQNSVSEIKKKKEILGKKYRKVRDFLEDPENQKTFRLLLRQTGKAFRHLFPRRIRGHVRFGLEDPYLVGRILCAVSPFYGFYGSSLSLEPVFDEKVLQGEAEFRGHIRLFTLLCIVLRVFANKNFRILMKKWRT